MRWTADWYAAWMRGSSKDAPRDLTLTQLREYAALARASH
jgi:hypothetical protein